MQFYKPHIKARIFADVPSEEVAKFYPPIDINKYPDSLELSCTVVRDCLQGNFALTLLLDVVNLSTYIKWQILNKKYRYIIVYAGYLGTDYYDAEDKDKFMESKLKIIFKGPILWMGTEVEARKKVTTRFLAVQNPAESLSAYNESMSLRYEAGYNLYQLINDLARINNNPNIKLNLSTEDYTTLLDNSVTIKNWRRKTIDSVLNLYGITITQGFDLTEGTISKETYIQMNSKRVLPDDRSNVVLVTEDTGLIDIPTLQNSGDYPVVRFKMLFNYNVKTFEYVKLKNSDIQLPLVDGVEDVTSLNTGIYLDNSNVSSGYGYYLVLKITYSLDSRGSNFIQEIEASPYELYNRIVQSSSSNK